MMRLLMLALLSVGILTGCGHYRYGYGDYRYAYGDCRHRLQSGECRKDFINKDLDIINSSYSAADNLMSHAVTTQYLEDKNRLWVTSIADIDNLEDSSSLGRLIGEQLAARFTQQGYTIIEARLHSGLIIVPRTGEFVLSQEWREIGRNQQVNAVVAGTYAVGRDTVYVTLKMLDFNSSKLIASYAYSLPLGPNTYALLRKWTWW